MYPAAGPAVCCNRASSEMHKPAMVAMYEVLKPVLFPVHPAGWPFIILFAGVTVVVGLFWAPFYIVGGALTLWCLCFFRNPERVTPTREGLIVSPADGLVQMLCEAVPPDRKSTRLNSSN